MFILQDQISEQSSSRCGRKSFLCLERLTDITKEVHWLIEMRNSVCLISDKVVQAVGTIGIEETIPDPFAGPYAMVC